MTRTSSRKVAVAEGTLRLDPKMKSNRNAIAPQKKDPTFLIFQFGFPRRWWLPEVACAACCSGARTMKWGAVCELPKVKSWPMF